jgi:hypothetical protein
MNTSTSRILTIGAALALVLSPATGVHAQSRYRGDRGGGGGDSSRYSNGPTSRPAGYRDRYIILSDQNIFVRDRSRIVPDRGDRPSGSGSDTRPTYVRPLEMSFVLTGVVLEEGLYRAYIEDSNASRILRLTVGDTVARGHIADIDINAIAYEANGQTKWVGLGCNLTGDPVSLVASSGSGSGSGSSGSGSTGEERGRYDRGERGDRGNSGGGPTSQPSLGVPAPPLPDGAGAVNLSLEEKMRLRRSQELKK